MTGVTGVKLGVAGTAGVGTGVTGAGVGEGVTGTGSPGAGKASGCGGSGMVEGAGSVGAAAGLRLGGWPGVSCARSRVLAARAIAGISKRVVFIVSSAVFLFLFLSVFAIFRLAIRLV